jgi:hypothetical protein
VDYRWFGNWGDIPVTTSTIEIGKLVIGPFDPAAKQLVLRGSASKDPDKNCCNLEKAMAKLFKRHGQALKVNAGHGFAGCVPTGEFGPSHAYV